MKIGVLSTVCNAENMLDLKSQLTFSGSDIAFYSIDLNGNTATVTDSFLTGLTEYDEQISVEFLRVSAEAEENFKMLEKMRQCEMLIIAHSNGLDLTKADGDGEEYSWDNIDEIISMLFISLVVGKPTYFYGEEEMEECEYADLADHLQDIINCKDQIFIKDIEKTLLDFTKLVTVHEDDIYSLSWLCSYLGSFWTKQKPELFDKILQIYYYDAIPAIVENNFEDFQSLNTQPFQSILSSDVISDEWFEKFVKAYLIDPLDDPEVLINAVSECNIGVSFNDRIRNQFNKDIDEEGIKSITFRKKLLLDASQYRIEKMLEKVGKIQFVNPRRALMSALSKLSESLSRFEIESAISSRFVVECKGTTNLVPLKDANPELFKRLVDEHSNLINDVTLDLNKHRLAVKKLLGNEFLELNRYINFKDNDKMLNLLLDVEPRSDLAMYQMILGRRCDEKFAKTVDIQLPGLINSRNKAFLSNHGIFLNSESIKTINSFLILLDNEQFKKVSKVLAFVMVKNLDVYKYEGFLTPPMVDGKPDPVFEENAVTLLNELIKVANVLHLKVYKRIYTIVTNENAEHLFDRVKLLKDNKKFKKIALEHKLNGGNRNE